MIYSNVVITGIGINYPQKNMITAEQLENHFSKQGIRIRSMMKVLGKERKFCIDKEDDYYDLLSGASKDALRNADLKAENIDILVVVADTPEYISPTNAVKLAKRIGANSVKVVYDLNANCAGGVVAIDQVSHYLQSSKNFSKAMITTSFFGSYISREDDPIAYSTFSDSAACIILEKKKENIERGFIDSAYKTDCNYDNMDVFPSEGFKNILIGNDRTDEALKLGINTEVDLSFIPDVWQGLLMDLLNKNNLNPQNVSKYLFSQFSLFHIVSTMAKLHLKKEHFVYVGNKYGYNGCCSPIFTLYSAVKSNRIHEGELIILCSIGAGYTSSAVLYKY